MNENEARVIKFGQIFDQKYGKGFCLAKWKYVQIFLHLGEGNSCYHPTPEKIPISEIKKNPSALHNNEIKIKERHTMMNGALPNSCEYCIKIEELKSEMISDRHIKSYEFAGGNLDVAENIFNEGLSEQVIPDCIEVSFSNKCNFKCVYCNPKASSYWQAEINKYGVYSGLENNFIIDKEILPEENEYTKAFEVWWPTLGSKLKALRITGGEPLLHKKTYEFLDKLSADPKPNLIIMINTNLGVGAEIVKNLIEKINYIEKNKLCKKIKLYVSLESVGVRAEYARFGLDYDLWLSNLKKILTETKCEISLMSTYNILAVTSFTEYLKLILSLRGEYNKQAKRILLDVPHLVNPRMLNVGLLGSEYLSYIDESIKFMEENASDSQPELFNSLEINQIKRIKSLWKKEIFSTIEKKRLAKEFNLYTKELDRRRNTSFKLIFPELIKFIEANEANET